MNKKPILLIISTILLAACGNDPAETNPNLQFRSQNLSAETKGYTQLTPAERLLAERPPSEDPANANLNAKIHAKRMQDNTQRKTMFTTSKAHQKDSFLERTSKDTSNYQDLKAQHVSSVEQQHTTR